MRSEDPGAPEVMLPDGGPRRLHVLSPVFFATSHAWRLWPLAVLVAARRQFWLLAVGALVLLAWSTVEWLRRTYSLEGGALRLEEGVLARKLRAVPFDRIQQVDLVRKPLHRLLGVATLRVETAGGGSAAEVDLDVVTLAEAQALRASLLRAKARLAAAPAGGPAAADGPAGRGRRRAEVAEAPAERVLLRLPLGEVMLAGITGSRAAAALVVLGPLSQATDWFPGLGDWLFQRFDPEAVTPTTPGAFLAVAVLAVVVWLGLAAASSIVTDYGFTLARVGNDLVVRRGLLERREAHPAPGPAPGGPDRGVAAAAGPRPGLDPHPERRPDRRRRPGGRSPGHPDPAAHAGQPGPGRAGGGGGPGPAAARPAPGGPPPLR